MKPSGRITLIGVWFAACTATAAPPPARAGPDLSPIHLDPEAQDLRLVSHRTNRTTIQGQETVVGAALDYALRVSTMADGPNRTILFAINTRHRADGQVFDMAPPADLSGTTLSAPVDEHGQLGDFELSRTELDGDPALGQITAVISQFFPRIPRDGILPGATWTDSTTIERTQQGADITVSETTRFRAGNWSDTTATRFLVIDWSRTYTITGSGEQSGLTFTLNGSGMSAGTHRFGANGSYLGTIASDSTTSDLMVTSLGMSIPLVQLGADTIRVEN